LRCAANSIWDALEAEVTAQCEGRVTGAAMFKQERDDAVKTAKEMALRVAALERELRSHEGASADARAELESKLRALQEEHDGVAVELERTR
jgi:hypothetical protein